ncbi:hypothetical protein EXD76_06070 [BEV proteobacterium]|nr:hypothetical protein [Candidatus Symbiopectobacterium sp. Chty_BC]
MPQKKRFISATKKDYRAMPDVLPDGHIILARPVHKYKIPCQSIREESASDCLNILISYFYQ